MVNPDEYIISLTLDGIEGLVEDEEDGGTVLAGTSSEFYPDYDEYDPYAAQGRGYYFNGNSILQLPPHTEDSSLSLVMAVENTISIWLKPTTAGGVLFTKQNNGFTQIYSVDLVTYTPRLSVYLYDWEDYEVVSQTSTTSLTNSAWHNLAVLMTVDT